VTCVRQDVVAGQEIAIGRPVPGMWAHVFDEHLAPVPPGEKGELCMGGAGLAIGYLNRPELTAVKFPEHPDFGRVYRTGDLVHQRADGTFVYHGRIDAQVKLRGYRIELEAIEAALAGCPGVREAACRVQGEGAAQALVAHVVPCDPARPPDPAALKDRLRGSVPAYMVPSLVGTIHVLPRNASGKLRRDELPPLAVVGRHRAPERGPRDPVEDGIARAVHRVLALPSPPCIVDDFFTELGGSSLHAAMLISELRTDPATAAVTVRDVYQARTIEELALRAAPHTAPDAPSGFPCGTTRPARPVGHPVRATVAQSTWLLLELLVGSVLAYLVVFGFLPWLSGRVGLVLLILLAPVLLGCVSVLVTPLTVAIAVHTKKLLIGRYEPGSTPAWSGLFVRMWIVRRVVRIVPWGTIAGTEFQCIALRRLGARIGKRVHIHRGVDLLQGGWDLLEIGDDVTLSQDASVRTVQLDAGQVVVGPVTLAAGATLDVRAGVGPHTRVGRDCWLSALSCLPAGATIPDGER
jgi:hypothetical protein